MYRYLRNRSYIFTAALILTVLTATATFAQNMGRISVEKPSSSPTNLDKTDITIIFDDPNSFNSAVNAARRAADPRAAKAVEQGIADNNPRLPKGVMNYYQHGDLANDTEGWDTNGFALGVQRSDSLSDLIFTWKCRPPQHYDAFNVRVRISDGREGQVEIKGGNHGGYRERNAVVGRTYTFLVQGCDKGTFGSNCTRWSQLKCTNNGGCS